MKRTMLIVLLLALTVPLAGCWDVKTLQDVDYYTAVGIDYREGKYRVYVQQLDFAKVAKSEGAKPDTPSPVWTGEAEGTVLADAIYEIYKTSQQQVFWGHLSAIVLTERALQGGVLLDSLDSLIRNREVRYTPWIFGTREKVVDVFTTVPFFNLSPLNSILHSPDMSYRQISNIEPMRLQRFLRELRDPASTVLLPSLRISEATWKKNRKPDPKLMIDGVFALSGESYRGWFGEDRLTGLQWMTDSSQASRLILNKNGKPAASLVCSLRKPRFRREKGTAGNVISVGIRLDVEVLGMQQPITIEEIEEQTRTQIHDDILSLYRSGKEKDADLLKLDHLLFRRDPALWHRLSGNGAGKEMAARLGDVRVEVRVRNSGMYKLDRKPPHP